MAMEKNKVKFGLNKVHYAKITSYDEEGVPTFAKPVRIPGAVSLSIDAEGEASNFYADDGVYYVINNNSGYTGDLEIVMIIVSVKMGAKPVLDIIPVACGVLTAYALIAFVGSRIAAIGSIMTFENNAQNMADLKGAIIGMIVCAVALIFTIISSFFKVVKD